MGGSMINSQLVSVQLMNVGAAMPTYATEEAAGADLYANLFDKNSGTVAESVVLPAGERLTVNTGVAIELDPGLEGQVRPRSGLAFKHGITIVNSPGTVDSDYRGEIKVILLNTGKEDLTIKHGDRIAQLVIAPYLRAVFEQADTLSDTDRGEGGLGSTGA